MILPWAPAAMPRLRTMLPILTSIAIACTGEPFASGGAGAVGLCPLSLASLGHTMAGLLIGLLIGLAVFLACRQYGKNGDARRAAGTWATSNGETRQPSVMVSLRDIVSEMVEISDDHTAYLNRKTGELISLADEVRDLLERDRSPDVLPEEQRWMISKARQVLDTDDFLELPPRFEIHEYSLVERFCDGIDDPDQRQNLKAALEGPRAFRSFSDAVGRLGMEQEWFRFRDQAFEELAISWLNEHEIAYDESSASA